mmetsp:Transcript_10363/g.10329  ORF Transcript_10363/g.10329 Transcript_10363/m.10329 type:complete len:596 (+) Transcript_10363:303-2090(+)
MCVFSLKIPFGSFATLPLKVEAELLYTNLELNGHKDKRKLRLLSSSPNFQSVERKVYLITNALNSVHQYMPLGFDPNYFCMFEGSIHVIFSNYEIESQNELQKFLFGDRPYIGGSEVDRAYYRMCDPIRLAYESIRNLIVMFNDRLFFSNSDVKCTVPPIISLPLFCQGTENKEMSLFEAIETHEQDTISEYIFEEITKLSELVKQSFKELIRLMSYNPEHICKFLKNIYDLQVTKYFHEYIITETKPPAQPSLYRENLPGFLKKAGNIRVTPYFSNLMALPIQADDLYNEIPNHPIFFVERFNSEKFKLESAFNFEFDSARMQSSICKILDLHLIVLVHGYRGGSKDVYLIKGYLNLIYPQCHVICAKSNEFSSDLTLVIQGQNLADEITQYIMENKIPLHRLKITFLAHSMGGLVVRAALPYLSRFKDVMFAFISLSSPHLGVKHADSYLLEFGKWVIKKFDHSDCFDQLTMHDSENVRQTFIYQLSQLEGLGWFEHVVLFGCFDDPYVPEYSSRVEVPVQSAPDKDLENAYKEMITNIWSKIDPTKITRVDVHFKNRELFNWLICCGNMHIDFLDNSCFIKMMCYGFPNLFA